MMIVFFILSVFLIVFPLFWMGIIYLISFLTGWHQMAKSFATQNFPTEYASSQSAVIGEFGNYNFILRVAVKPEGLYLGVFLLFKPGHPDILIPWSEITQVTKRKIPLLFGEAYKLIIGEPRITSILLQAKHFAGYEEKLQEKMKI